MRPLYTLCWKTHLNQSDKHSNLLLDAFLSGRCSCGESPCSSANCHQGSYSQGSAHYCQRYCRVDLTIFITSFLRFVMYSLFSICSICLHVVYTVCLMPSTHESVIPHAVSNMTVLHLCSTCVKCFLKTQQYHRKLFFKQSLLKLPHRQTIFLPKVLKFVQSFLFPPLI